MDIKNWLLKFDDGNASRNQDWWSRIPEDALPAPVPGLVQQVFPDGYGVAIYYAQFNCGHGQCSTDIPVLHFGAADYFAEVRLNGRYLGSHEGGEIPFSFELNGCVVPDSSCLLAVRIFMPAGRACQVIDDIDFMQIPLGARVHPFYPGLGDTCFGLLKPVFFDWKPAVRMTDCQVTADCDTGLVTANVTLRNLTQGLANARITLIAARHKDGSQMQTLCRDFQLDGEDGSVSLQIRYDEFLLWNIDDPQLYDVQVLVEFKGRIDSRVVRTGFRKLEVRNGFFRLNGRRLFLKCTHTGCGSPGACNAETASGLWKQDMVLAKAAGFNMVRFISGMPSTEQLDICDELGLMVYEENAASWWYSKQPDKTKGPACFIDRLRGMILRDRNHPSITIWGLLNENISECIFEAAVGCLPLLRSLDSTRLVLLSSGRWDMMPSIGSISNPGSSHWEHEWGTEAPDAVGKADANDFNPNGGKYFSEAGDVHIYLEVPHGRKEKETIRRLGGTKPVFLSEYGIGSLPNTISFNRGYESIGVNPRFSDFRISLHEEDALRNDWTRWGLGGIYPTPEAFLEDSARISARERRRGFELVRANPWLCGWNLTSMLDSLAGEGLWDLFRYVKPQHLEVLQNGWAPLRWCLDVTPWHASAGTPVALEAVLANEDILPPGFAFTATFRVTGQGKEVWKCTKSCVWPAEGPAGEPPLAWTVLSEKLPIALSPGEYVFSAEINHGGDVRDATTTFFVSETATRRRSMSNIPFFKCGKFAIEPEADDLATRKDWNTPALIAVGDYPDDPIDWKTWKKICEGIEHGDTVVFFSPSAFKPGCFTTDGVSFKCLDENGNRITPPMDFSQTFNRADGRPDCQMWYAPHFRAENLKPGNYTVQIDCAEFLYTEPGLRYFDVTVNGRPFLTNFDIIAETGAPGKHAVRTCNVEVGSDGIIDITTSRQTALSELAVFNADGKCLARSEPYLFNECSLFPIPEGRTSTVYEFHDTLYHKECLLSNHPVFAGMQACGIARNDYWGTLPGHTVWCSDSLVPDETMAAGLATGYFIEGGYKAGIMLGRFRMGLGRFYISTFDFFSDCPVAARLFAAILDDAARL